MAGGNAEKSGVRAGDIIESMEDKLATQLTLEEAQGIIKSAGLNFKINISRLIYNVI